MMPQYQTPPSAAPGNFFLPTPAPSAAPAYGPPMASMMPAPAYGPPMVPMMPAPAYGPPMVPAAPQPAMMGTAPALAGSSVAVPTSSSSSSVEIRGPGLLCAGLARVGERLVQLGRTRVRTVQETVLQTPRSQPLGGMATIATSGLTPGQAPVAPSAPSAPSAPPGREEAPPMAPTPSPQGARSHHEHSLLNHLLGHD